MFAFLYHPAIDPLILQIYGPLGIRWYSLMYIVGFLFCYLFILYRIKKNIIKIDAQILSDVIFAAFLGVLVGARLGYVLFYNLQATLANPMSVFAVWNGGMSFHGGMIGIVLGILVYALIKKINFLDLADVVGVPVPMALAFGRWGNFVNGELWGRPTDAPWGMIFPGLPQAKWFPASEQWVRDMAEKAGMIVPPNATLVNLPRHPSQLYEMFLEGVVLFFVLYLVSKLKDKPRGLITWTFFLGYGLARFFIEFFREPDAQLGYLAGGWFTMGMVLSLPMAAAGLAGLIYTFIKNKRNDLWA
jgi:phosphatidylglycerol---prolipoprotein diacylglyceryl transferase